jgi:type II secretory pathway component PulJ
MTKLEQLRAQLRTRKAEISALKTQRRARDAKITAVKRDARAAVNLAGRLQSAMALLEKDVAALATAKGRPKKAPQERRAELAVSPAERADRRDAFNIYIALRQPRGLEFTEKYFCSIHNQTASEFSRWLAGKTRCILPGSASDNTFWRLLAQDIRRMLRDKGSWQLLSAKERERWEEIDAKRKVVEAEQEAAEREAINAKRQGKN